MNDTHLKSGTGGQTVLSNFFCFWFFFSRCFLSSNFLCYFCLFMLFFCFIIGIFTLLRVGGGGGKGIGTEEQISSWIRLLLPRPQSSREKGLTSSAAYYCIFDSRSLCSMRAGKESTQALNTVCLVSSRAASCCFRKKKRMCGFAVFFFPARSFFCAYIMKSHPAAFFFFPSQVFLHPFFFYFYIHRNLTHACVSLKLLSHLYHQSLPDQTLKPRNV